MAAVQTNVFRDGVWVTETVGLQAVLHAAATPKGTKKRDVSVAPAYGILTRTVLESPLVHSILAVRLRSTHLSDIAFVGVSQFFCLPPPRYSPEELLLGDLKFSWNSFKSW
jgi:hypothetical protein